MESPFLSEEEEEENSSSDDDDDDHYGINRLIDEEIEGVGLYDQQIRILMNDNWYRQARIHAIPYILNRGGEFEFSRQTVYTAVMYLDRFLANRRLPNGLYLAVELLAVSCLSLSAEFNERIDNVPRLGSYNINVNAIRKTRRWVLDEFNGDMNCVTPFAFIDFFVLRFCRIISRREITRRRTGELIMSVVTEVRIMITDRPSVIAAAATLLAVCRNFTIQSLNREINLLHINRFLHDSNMYFMYSNLRELNYS